VMAWLNLIRSAMMHPSTFFMCATMTSTVAGERTNRDQMVGLACKLSPIALRIIASICSRAKWMPAGELSESKGHPHIPWSSLLQLLVCIRFSFSHIKNVLTHFESPDLGIVKKGSNRISPVAPVSHLPCLGRLTLLGDGCT
jgi:hypothetical protein